MIPTKLLKSIQESITVQNGLKELLNLHFDWDYNCSELNAFELSRVMTSRLRLYSPNTDKHDAVLKLVNSIDGYDKQLNILGHTFRNSQHSIAIYSNLDSTEILGGVWATHKSE